MQRHVDNTRTSRRVPRRAIRRWSRCPIPNCPDHRDHELAKKLLPNGCGAVFSFSIKGGRPAGKRFIETLKVFSHLANVGDAKSLVIHPATTTHYRMDDAALRAAGITEGTVRLSVGLGERGGSDRGSGPGAARFAERLSVARSAQRDALSRGGRQVLSLPRAALCSTRRVPTARSPRTHPHGITAIAGN